MRPRIVRLGFDELNQSQRIIKTISQLLDKSYNDVRRVYYRTNQDVQQTIFNLKMDKLRLDKEMVSQ